MMDLIERAEKFKKALLEKHPRITFNLSNYETKLDEIEFICSTHGPFIASPRNVLRSRYGCTLCYKELVKVPPKNVITPRKDNDTYIEQATLLHKGFYTYEKTNYITKFRPVIITCPLHGDFEIPYAHEHITHSRGCLECRRQKSMLTLEQFINKCKKRTKNFYTYTNTIYDGLDKEVQVECEYHGSFTILANSHINGKGCDQCRKHRIGQYKEKKV